MDLRSDDRARCAGSRRKHFDFQIVSTGNFYAAIVEHLRAVSYQTKHFFIADFRKTLGIRVTTGIPVVNAVHIRKYLTKISL